MKKFYVIGNPIKQSLSPTIFNYWFRKYKLEHTYEKKTIHEKNFNENVLKLINSEECAGINITVPYKNKILNIIKEIQE